MTPPLEQLTQKLSNVYDYVREKYDDLGRATYIRLQNLVPQPVYATPYGSDLSDVMFFSGEDDFSDNIGDSREEIRNRYGFQKPSRREALIGAGIGALLGGTYGVVAPVAYVYGRTVAPVAYVYGRTETHDFGVFSPLFFLGTVTWFLFYAITENPIAAAALNAGLWGSVGAVPGYIGGKIVQAIVEAKKLSEYKTGYQLESTIAKKPVRKSMQDTYGRCQILQSTDESYDIRQIAPIIAKARNITSSEVLLALRGRVGIIDRRLDFETAEQIMTGLNNIGVKVFSMIEDEVISLPLTGHLKKVELANGFLQMHGLDGSYYAVPYSSVDMLCYGMVTEEKRRTEATRPGIMSRKVSRMTLTSLPEREERREYVETNAIHLLDIYAESQHFRIEAGKLSFESLGERKTDNSRTNFRLLLEDIVENATEAYRNRGVDEVLDGNFTGTTFGSVRAFDEYNHWLVQLYYKGMLGEKCH